MTDLTGHRYLESHEWIRAEDGVGTVGISDFAQQEISDIVYIELPKAGREVKQKESCMVIESVKAAFDIYAPVSGTITEINSRLADEPQLVNQAPYADGWLFKIRLSDPAELENLMDHAAYETRKSQAH